MCLSKDILLGKLTKKTKVIIVVNLYGYPVDIQDLRKHISSEIIIIEDCAESLGSYRNSKHCGFYSDFATFSFLGNKTTTGRGMLYCSKKKIKKKQDY